MTMAGKKEIGASSEPVTITPVDVHFLCGILSSWPVHLGSEDNLGLSSVEKFFTKEGAKIELSPQVQIINRKMKEEKKARYFRQLTDQIKFFLVRMGRDSTASHVKFVQKVRASADPELVHSQRKPIDPLCSKVTVILMVSHLLSAYLHTVRLDGLHYTWHHVGVTRRRVVYCMQLVLTSIHKTRFVKCVQTKA